MDKEFRNRSIQRGSVVDIMNYSFTVTQNCNLACKYCYECKNNNSRMSLETAKRAVDFALGYNTAASSVRFDFMGGEPLLEIEMIDAVVDYIKFKLYEENHKWFGRYGIDLTTNGVLFNTDSVQRFIKKNSNCLNISMTIDGTKEKHNMNRIFKDGQGTFESVIKNVPLWLEQFPEGGTKVTFASADIMYLKESLIFLNSLGIKEIVATLVNEDVWKEGDDLIYERQLCELADYMVENNLPMSFSGGQFTENTGLPYNKDRLKLNWCNCGDNNFEIDYRGNLYPCVRFLPFALGKDDRMVGNIYTGLDINKLRPFEALNYTNQSSEECLDCPVADGCSWCSGNNYNNNPNNSIFSRETAICKMHKARARANDYYWAKMHNRRGIVRTIPNIDRKRFVYIMLSDNSVSYCTAINHKNEGTILSISDFRKGLQFARMNFYTPVILYDDKELEADFESEIEKYEVMKIKPYSMVQKEVDGNSIIVLETKDIENLDWGKSFRQIILHISKDEISTLSCNVIKLFGFAQRINIMIDDWTYMTENDCVNYRQKLEQLADAIIEYAKKSQLIQLNVLTDIMITSDRMNCGAGYSSVLLAPNGDLYPCSSFYYSKKYDSIGNLDKGIINDISIYNMEKAPICTCCDISSCHICAFNNIETTNEYKIPSLEQCKIKNIEKSVSVDLQKRLIELNDKTPFKRNVLQQYEYPEALDLIVHEKYMQYR